MTQAIDALSWIKKCCETQGVYISPGYFTDIEQALMRESVDVESLKNEAFSWTRDLLNKLRTEYIERNPEADANAWGQEEWLVMEITVKEYIDHIAKLGLLRTPGYVMVPVEPTEEMLNAAANANPQEGERTARAKYKAMISAAKVKK
jgi:hypothetical protein